MSTWNRSSSTCRSRKPSSNALRRAPIVPRKTWSSMRTPRVVALARSAACGRGYGRVVTENGNPWLDRRVLNYAHRGGAEEAPSSTLFAMEQAVAAGADALELDVHATSDGVLVVCHDPTVDATTDATGPIAAMTLAEVRRLDNAYRFTTDDGATWPYRGRPPDDPRFAVATLREVLEAFPHVFVNLDIKQTAPAVEAYEPALAALLREFGRSDDVIVASFLDQATDAFSAVAPEIHTSAG